MSESVRADTSMWAQVRGLPANYWYVNIIEMLERLAFFGSRAVAPLYLVSSASKNGLGLSFEQKGDIFMWWALLQCIIPMVSGGYSDRYGYRKSLVVAFLLNILGYVGMAQSLAITNYLSAQGWTNAGYWVFLAAACLVATGTAIFKPPIQGTIAKLTREETSSMAWGIFYWVVNIGGALAPMCAAPLRGEVAWDNVFYAAAIVTALNFLPAFLLYREPQRAAAEASAGNQPQKGPLGVFASSVATIFGDPRLLAFLLIFSCFWLMFMQLWDLLPNFIDEWVDTRDLAPAYAWASSWFGGGWVLPHGQVKPEMLININAWSIILFVLLVSWLISRLNKVLAMVIGMLISLVGFVGSGATDVGWLCALMIFVFSLGEMTCSPTFSAYVAIIAPAEKKALYMGYSNIPFAIGWAAGNKISGWMYEHMSSKINLARRYLVEELGHSPAASDKTALPDEQVMETLASALGEAARGAGSGPGLSEIAARTLADVLARGAEVSVGDAQRVLWNTYDPQMVWYWLGLVGLVGTLGMIVFYLATRRKASAPGPPFYEGT